MSRLTHLLAAAASSTALLLSAGVAHADPSSPFSKDNPPPSKIVSDPGSPSGIALVSTDAQQGRIVNGTRATTSSAPWTAFLLSMNGYSGFSCGGVVIDPVTIVTAAHCTDGVKPGTDANHGGMAVTVGISDDEHPEATAQTRLVTAMRVHPQWTHDINTNSGGDIAVLTLDHALTLGLPTAQAVTLPAPVTPGTDPLVGPQAASISGFGQENAANDPDGKLYALSTAIVSPDVCGDMIYDASAVDLCVQTPSGTVCHGDSGSGLVSAGASPVLLGIVSAGQSCDPGAASVFTSVVAPENRAFIANQPITIAPRNGAYVRLNVVGNLAPGGVIGCSGGGWSGNPTIKWVVTNETGATVASGLGTTFSYTIAATDVGHTLSCRSYASNAGGVGSSELATAYGAVQAARTTPTSTTPGTGTSTGTTATGSTPSGRKPPFVSSDGVTWVNDVVAAGPMRVRRGSKVHFTLRYGLDNGIERALENATFYGNGNTGNWHYGHFVKGQTTVTDRMPVRFSKHAKPGRKTLSFTVGQFIGGKIVSMHYVDVTVIVTR